jgi:hypothetical protein
LEESRERLGEINERASEESSVQESWTEITNESYTSKFRNKINEYSEEVFDGSEIFRSKRIDEYFDKYFYFYGKKNYKLEIISMHEDLI